MPQHRIVSRDEWLAARRALLAKEKELTRLRDRLSAERRELPWVRVERNYVFDTAQGKKTLAELFEGRSQLFVYHFMFGPDWEEGCIGCSFAADHFDGAAVHLEHHDVTVVAVSRAPLAKLEAYKKRMGWRFKWVSSAGSDFNYDYHVSFTREEMARGRVFYNFGMTDASIEELPGASVFYRDENGDIYHTYSAYARGGEELLGAYVILDATPNGRNETGPYRNLMDWVKRHDQYEEAEGSQPCCATGTAQRSGCVRA
jgi:predicted dithiol-disulfide oxidoreductase (DUF899 family)